MAGELQRIGKLGFSIAQQGHIGGNRFAYFDTEGGHPSTVMELFGISGTPGPFFERIRQAAATWDGSIPSADQGEGDTWSLGRASAADAAAQDE